MVDPSPAPSTYSNVDEDGYSEREEDEESNLGEDDVRVGDIDLELEDQDHPMAPDTPYTAAPTTGSTSASAAAGTPASGLGMTAPAASLSIFAPPSDSPATPLPDALQNVITASAAAAGSGSGSASTATRKLRDRAPPPPPPTIPTPVTVGPNRERDTMVKDAADGLKRVRSTRGRDSTAGAGGGGSRSGARAADEEAIRAGVSASGKGVKVGGTQRVGAGPKRRPKGRGEEVVRGVLCNLPHKSWTNQAAGLSAKATELPPI